MPSHADPVRLQDHDARAAEEQLPAARREELKRPLAQLERYAGWLTRSQLSAAVRADVQSLGAAVDAGRETSLLLVTLDKNLARLPGGAVRKMLRKASGQVRDVLGHAGLEPSVGRDS